MRIKGYVSARRNTAADWVRKHIRPEESELVHEFDTNKFKLGDGIHYAEDPALPYFIDELAINAKIAAVTVGGTAIVHDQPTPSANWIVSHTFGRLPAVAIYIDGALALTDVDADNNTVSVVFSSPVSGKLVLT